MSPGLEGMAHCLAAVAEAVAEHHLLQDVAHYGDGSGQESLGEGIGEVRSWGPSISPAAALKTFPFLSIHKHLSGANWGLLSEYKGGS